MDKKEITKMKEIMKATPNTLGTFNMLMLLGHTLHEKNGKNYSVQINFKEDYVALYEEK